MPFQCWVQRRMSTQHGRGVGITCFVRMPPAFPKARTQVKILHQCSNRAGRVGAEYGLIRTGVTDAARHVRGLKSRHGLFRT